MIYNISMTAVDIIKYWRDSAADAFDTSEKLFSVGKYQHCLFFLHLALEKVIKAVYIQKKAEAAPPIHDLVRLSERAEIQIGIEEKEDLAEISTFNIAARYDDYKLQFYKKATFEYTTGWFGKSKKLYGKFLLLLS